MLRAIIWWITGNASRATRVATAIGQFIAFAFIILGLFRFFNCEGFGGLWLTFIGWCLLNAARSTLAQFETIEQLRGLRVRDVMASFTVNPLLRRRTLRQQATTIMLSVGAHEKVKKFEPAAVVEF